MTREGCSGRISRAGPHAPSRWFHTPSTALARPTTDDERRPLLRAIEARELLVSQLTAPVRWAASIIVMVQQGADRFLELGPGSVLCGLNKRNARGLTCSSVGAPKDIEVMA